MVMAASMAAALRCSARNSANLWRLLGGSVYRFFASPLRPGVAAAWQRVALFASGVQFCGVFAYKAHVSVEFGDGAAMDDPFGCLEGSGKGRRHIKLRSLADMADKRLADYLPLALEASRRAATQLGHA